MPLHFKLCKLVHPIKDSITNVGYTVLDPIKIYMQVTYIKMFAMAKNRNNYEMKMQSFRAKEQFFVTLLRHSFPQGADICRISEIRL